MFKTFTFFFTLMTSLFLQAQTNAVFPVKTVDINKDFVQLSKLNKQFFRNFLNNDTIAHNKIVHKDFICIASNGAIINRNDYMKSWSHDYDPGFNKSFIQQNESIRLFGNTALVMAETVCSYMENEKVVFRTTFYTDTYLKLNGRWWCVQAQLTTKK